MLAEELEKRRDGGTQVRRERKKLWTEEQRDRDGGKENNGGREEC